MSLWKWWFTLLQSFLFPRWSLKGNEVINGGLLQLLVFPGLSDTAENESSQKTTAIPTISIHFISVSGRKATTELFTLPPLPITSLIAAV